MVVTFVLKVTKSWHSKTIKVQLLLKFASGVYCIYFYATKKAFEIVKQFYKDSCDLMLGTYVNIELVNPLTKCILLVIG